MGDYLLHKRMYNDRKDELAITTSMFFARSTLEIDHEQVKVPAKGVHQQKRKINSV